MFEGLQAIPWQDLKHAYGSAEDVPMWLRQLASDDEQMHHEAINHLAASLCHQGWICPATGYAVPYLIALLQEPPVQGKDAILRLLADIADAPPLDEETWRKNPEVPSWEVPAHILFKDAQEEALAGIPVYSALLDAPELRVRMWAATLLVRFPERAQEVWPLLQAALERELTEQGQANLVLVLGNLARYLPDQRPFFLEAFQAGQSELRAFAAALALTRVAQAETPEEVAHLLAQVMMQAPASLNAFQELPCGGGKPWQAASWTLFYVGSKRLQFLVPLLEERLSQAEREETFGDALPSQRFAELLLFSVFGDKPETSRKPRPVATLTEQQRSILLLVLEREKVWISSHLHDLLVGQRLPDTREKMAVYLGRELPPTR